jgi:thymidylate synthase (FAD)
MIKVEFIDKMGSDISVVNAARVSFNKKSDFNEDGSFKEGDEKLIAFLARENHWTPFGHASLSFHIKAPIFVARQLAKHQVGGVINEVSRRYVDSEPEIYYPDNWRKRNKDKKQGSHEDQFVDVSFSDNCSIYASCDIAISTYKSLLNAGVCPEQARMVLPQNMMTEWYWSGTLYFFSRVCNLRLSKDVQLETRFVAQQIKDIMLQHFPISCKYILK